MKVKQIIGCFLMIILTVLGIVLSLGLSAILTLNSNGIINSMIEADYLETSKKEAEETLKNYLSEEKVEEILDEISVKSQIREITEAFDNNTVSEVAKDMEQTMKKQIVAVLDEDIPEDNKESFANVVSLAYIKAIFPVTEFSLLSNMYKTYSTKLVLVFCVIAILLIAIYLYLANSKKMYKWAIIAIYNIMILSIIIIVMLGTLNNIVIGNIRTTAVINEMLLQIKQNMILAIIILAVIAIISNYIAYFKKRKKHSN